MPQDPKRFPTIQSFFSEKGILGQRLPRYENRPEQEQMAQAIGKTLEQDRKLIVEAGTGTGKSFAYLIPSILWAVKNKKRVCISTFTKALQQQLVEKDLPFLSETLGIDFKYSLCLGGNNYLSKRRLAVTDHIDLFSGTSELEQMEALRKFGEASKTGLRLELPFQVLPSVWEEMGRQNELCLGKKCPYAKNCFYNLARKEWFASHLIVVNHHLFFANLANNLGVLPQFHAVVFDEAHNIEDVATSYFGIEVTNTGLRYTLDRLYNPKTGKGYLSRVSGVQNKYIEPIVKAADIVRQESEKFFSEVTMKFENAPGLFRLRKPHFMDNNLHLPLQKLVNELNNLTKMVEDTAEARLEPDFFIGRFKELDLNLDTVISQSMKDYVYWFEHARMKRYDRLSLKGCPIDISHILNQKIFEKEPPVFLTSATLATNNNFDFISGRLGLKKKDQLVFTSPFRFDKQVLLYTVKEFPDPSVEPEKFFNASVQKIKELLEAGSGRAFILFTSYSMLNRVHAELSQADLPWKLIKQGEMPPSRAIQLFKEDKESIILGTNTFWEGVDVPGDALQSVIITKLPFSVPTEPVVEARIERLKAAGKNPFFEFQVPRAIVMLKQGFGRLVRHKGDRGMVAILDPRIHTKAYGKMFINSLPKCMETNDLKEVKRFFERIRD